MTAIPVSALLGENIAQRSANMTWYEGPVLLEYLETVDVTSGQYQRPLRLPVQWVCRPNSDFRGYAGTIEGGQIARGDPIVALPGSQQANVVSIFVGDEERTHALAGEAVLLTLDREIDISRGDLLCAPETRRQL